MRNFLKKILGPFLKTGSELYLKKRRQYSYKDISVWVEPGIFPPFITFSTKILLDLVDSLELKKKHFLELGCGCGIISILAAKKGAHVTATDINDAALEALAQNAMDNAESIRIIRSDLFDELKGKHFDYIVINPPYYPKNPGSVSENAWYCGENFEYFEKLFHQLPTFLSAENSAFMILSEDCQIDKIRFIAEGNGVALDLFSEKKVMAERNFIFRLVSA